MSVLSAGAAPAANRARGVGSPVAASLAGKAAEMITLLLLATVVPRALGPGDYGQFAVALTIVTIGSVSMALGGPTLMARFVPAAPVEDRAGLARSLGLRLAVGRGAQLAFLSVVAAALSAWDPDRFPPLLTFLVTVSLILNVAATLALQAALGLGRTGWWSVRYPLQNAVLIGAVLILHPLGGATGAVVAIAISSAVAVGLGAWAAMPLLSPTIDSVVPPPGALRFAALQAAGGVFVQIAHRGGVVAVAVLVGSDAQTGYVALALGVALAATYSVLQTFTVSLPLLAQRPVDQGSEAQVDAERVLRRIAGASLAVIVPGAVILALLIDEVVAVVFGDRFAGAADAFGPAIAFVVLAPVNALALQVAALRLRPWATLWSAVGGAAAFTAVAVLLVPTQEAAGGTGAALAGAAVAALVSMALLPGAVGRRVGIASLGGSAAVLAMVTVT